MTHQFKIFAGFLFLLPGGAVLLAVVWVLWRIVQMCVLVHDSEQE